MAPTLDFISLVVDDLARAAAFYRDGFGISEESITAEQDHVRIEFENEVTLVLYARSSFEKQFGDLVASSRAGGVILSRTVEAKNDVEALIRRAISAGGSQAGSPEEQDWGGYAGYLKDPDGHLWEIVWDSQV